MGTQKNRLNETVLLSTQIFEHPKHMFKLKDKKITFLRLTFLLNWPYVRYSALLRVDNKGIGQPVQMLSGRVLGLRLSGCWFKPLRRHCAVSFNMTLCTSSTQETS